MPQRMGHTAIVIGAGIGGLSAAAALSGFFKHVIVLERDALPDDVRPRTCVPQGRHAHVLLSKGLEALQELLPGLGHTLMAAGAVRYRAGLDLRVERPGFDPFPQRDVGWDVCSSSRPLLEAVVRQAVLKLPSVSIRALCNVQALLASHDGRTVRGVTVDNALGQAETIHADLVVDASGRGAPTWAFMEAYGLALPEEASIGIDFNYATAVFQMPSDPAPDWKALMVAPDPQVSPLCALLLPIEAGRWVVSIGAAHSEKLPGDPDGFMDSIAKLRTPTLHQALRHAERIGDVARFAFAASTRRHVEQLSHFPRGVLPIADAICRFNPVHGQGMSVAAMEAVALKAVLTTLQASDRPLDQLAPAFFATVPALIDTPWAVANLDFAHPQTRGTRPPDIEMRLRYFTALNKAAARDPEVHKVMLQVQHLLQPRSAYHEPALMQKIIAEMSAAG